SSRCAARTRSERSISTRTEKLGSLGNEFGAWVAGQELLRVRDRSSDTAAMLFRMAAGSEAVQVLVK
ncbi:hypothetical protein, partial [Bradyrhizobium murdochi]|uniref:hypothetical protein n=1 Tax=Bradyrhizobium murdochi TaxID=1038859 RepID=UPI001AEBCC8E